jgi:maltooligosyltrehalose trehalohydrolase
MAWDTAAVPDPQDPATFRSSVLDWSELDGPRGRTLLATYRALAALRRELPALTDPDLRKVSCEVDEDERWLVMRRGSGADAVDVVANFSDREVAVPLADATTYVVAYATPGGQAVGSLVDGDRLPLPPHTGLLLRPDLA